VPALLLAAVPSLEFEAQKLAARLCGDVLRAGCDGHLPESVSAYLCSRPQVVELLLRGSCDETLTFLYGELLLLGARDTSFARVLLAGGADIRLLNVAASPTGIEVKAMALACLRGLLLESGDAAPEHLEDPQNFRLFFSAYHKLITDRILLVQRQAQDLLAQVLLSPNFRSVRTMYISSALCLKLQMSLLRHPVVSVRLGAFHVFKIFVANPYKRRNVQALLHRNKERLACLLRGLCDLSEVDDNCSADLRTVWVEVLALTAPPSAPSKPCVVSPCC
jgi:calcium binding protein 39